MATCRSFPEGLSPVPAAHVQCRERHRSNHLPLRTIKNYMARIAQMATSLLCIVTILAVCIAPLVDLPPTSLRYQFVAMFLIGCILGRSAARSGSALKSNLFSSDLMPPRSRLMLRSPLQTNSVLQR